jgi:hypothetical protein
VPRPTLALLPLAFPQALGFCPDVLGLLAHAGARRGEKAANTSAQLLERLLGAVSLGLGGAVVAGSGPLAPRVSHRACGQGSAASGQRQPSGQRGASGSHQRSGRRALGIDDYVEKETGVVAAATAAAVSPRARELFRRGAVYGLAGVLKASDVAVAAARGAVRGAKAGAEAEAGASTRRSARSGSGASGRRRGSAGQRKTRAQARERASG